MLVLSRKVGEKIMIGADVTLKVASIRGERVSLAFHAPASVVIHREEVQRRLELESQSDGYAHPAESRYHSEFA